MSNCRKLKIFLLEIKYFMFKIILQLLFTTRLKCMSNIFKEYILPGNDILEKNL